VSASAEAGAARLVAGALARADDPTRPTMAAAAKKRLRILNAPSNIEANPFSGRHPNQYPTTAFSSLDGLLIFVRDSFTKNDNAPYSVFAKIFLEIYEHYKT
jgi:hypothetical protein